MHPGNPSERKYSDEEVALIIKRAAELQQTEQAANDPGNALSLSEIEQIGRETGIDPVLVRRAALGLDRPHQTNRPSPWLGAPTHVVFERVVDGEIPVEEFEVLIDETRRTFGDVGLSSVIGRSLAWSSSGSARRRASGRQVQVTAVVRSGTTTIRVEEEYRNLAGGLLGGMVGGGGGGTTGLTVGASMAAFHSPALSAALWVTVVGGFYTLARTIYSNIVSKRERELSALADRLAEQVKEVAKTPPQIAAESSSRR
jgi:hypothetical protein